MKDEDELYILAISAKYVLYLLWRSSVLESLTWRAATTVDKRSPLLPISEVVVVVFLFLFRWTAWTFDEAYLFTVTVSAINMLWLIELISVFDLSHSFFWAWRLLKMIANGDEVFLVYVSIFMSLLRSNYIIPLPKT